MIAEAGVETLTRLLFGEKLSGVGLSILQDSVTLDCGRLRKKKRESQIRQDSIHLLNISSLSTYL